MIIKKYNSTDCAELAALFYNTVHTVNAGDYSKEQLNAWADGNIDLKAWDQSFLQHYTIVAVEDGIITGFGDIDTAAGYLDRLFVHAGYQGRGIGSAICERLERAVRGKIIVHASITARSFFEQRGYQLLKKQQVVRHGIWLENFVMEKYVI